MDKTENKEKGYTIRSLLDFIGTTGVQMDTELKIAGKENGAIYMLTYVPDGNILYLDERKYWKE